MRSKMIIHPEELSSMWIDRLSRAGISTLGIHPVGGAEASETLARMLEDLQGSRMRAILDEASARGLLIEYELHAAGYLLPRTLFSVHPEYFRMNAEEERTPDFNFCASSEEALDLIAARAAELAEKLYGSTHRFFFWMDDGGRGVACNCARCRNLSASDQQMRALNRMIGAMRRRIPDATLSYLAYFDTLELPSIPPAEGLFLEYAPYEKYVSAHRPDGEARIAREVEALEKQTALFGRENAVILEYWYDNSLFSKYKKPPVRFVPDAERIRKEAAAYAARGYTDLATFACFLGADYEELYGAVDVMPFADALQAVSDKSAMEADQKEGR